MQDIYKRLIKELFWYRKSRIDLVLAVKKTILRYMLAVFKYKNNEQVSTWKEIKETLKEKC